MRTNRRVQRKAVTHSADPLHNTGPNAVLYTLEPYVDELLSVLLHFYPAISGTSYV